jgi:prolipoprotein diacylglyceryltransferase
MNNIFEENIQDFEIFCILSGRNPGACSVLMCLFKNIESEKLNDFFIKILNKEIVGARLWYIYKNECNENINELIDKDLTPFTDFYFYEKFEKYI